MIAPRIEVDLTKIEGNTRTLVGRLAARGIGVTGVTKGVRGHPAIARAMLAGGVRRLADARVSGVERMRAAGIDAPMLLIRTPMISQADRIVRACDISLNTDVGVIGTLARAARNAGRVHEIVLMVELGDGREGIRPGAVGAIARAIAAMDGIVLSGLGANFACLSGRAPDPTAMAELSSLATAIEADLGIPLTTVSGGGSANLSWALGQRGPSRVDDLRLGEAILLGRDPLSGRAIEGLATDAFRMVAEVIETADDTTASGPQRAGVHKAIIALGSQDTEIDGLKMPGRMTLVGATSDHLVVAVRAQPLVVGAEVTFAPSYSAVSRATGAPDMTMVMRAAFMADPTPGPRTCQTRTPEAA